MRKKIMQDSDHDNSVKTFSTTNTGTTIDTHMNTHMNTLVTPRLPAHNPYIGTFYHGLLIPPLFTYSHYAFHSPHVPFLRHAAPTAPISRIIHDMMMAEQTKREQCGEDDWVFVEDNPTNDSQNDV